MANCILTQRMQHSEFDKQRGRVLWSGTRLAAWATLYNPNSQPFSPCCPKKLGCQVSSALLSCCFTWKTRSPSAVPPAANVPELSASLLFANDTISSLVILPVPLFTWNSNAL